MDGAEGADGVDGLVEWSSRSLAGRTTRRSFLGRAGKAAVLVAGGPALATFLAEEAEARVCGQSGVAPKCPTYDCDHTWGWCWYASGCCTDGLLKKICDCCAPNTPHPVGYCPSGTRVFCIVESCGTDPRLQRRPVNRMATDDSFDLLGRIRRFRFPNGSPFVVFGSDQSLALASVAFPVASMVDGPLHLVSRSAISAATLDELTRSGARSVVAVGPSPDDATVARELTPRGIAFRRIGTSDDPATLSLEVAAWAAAERGVGAMVAVGASEAVSITTALSLATGLAARARIPLVIGNDAARAAVDGSARVPWAAAPTVHLVGTEAATLPIIGAQVYAGMVPPVLAERVVAAGTAMGGSSICPVFASWTSPAAWASAHLGQPLVLHDPRDPFFALRYLDANGSRAVSAIAAGVDGVLSGDGMLAVQSRLNGFAAEKLRGVSGEGLPVISQPFAERPIGLARQGLAPTRVRVRRGRRWVWEWVWP